MRLAASFTALTLFSLVACEGSYVEPEELAGAEWSLSKCLGGANGKADYCDSGCTCSVGEGDCDTDSECDPGLVCGTDNGARFSQPTKTDFCWESHCENGVQDGDETDVDCGGSCGAVCASGYPPGDANYCRTESWLCAAGEGDCDIDAHCRPGLVCANDLGADFGFDPLTDVCIGSHCANSSQDGDETGVDCGGSCVPCPPAPAFASASSGANDRVWLPVRASGDGRYTVFASPADNLVAGDTNGVADVFRYDRDTDTLTIISASSAGAAGNGHSYRPSISDDGRYVAYLSDATNLVTTDTNGVTDVFVTDVGTSTTTLVSAPSGAEANGRASYPALSANGKWITFTSEATNLVAGDTNGVADIFLTLRGSGSFTLVSHANGSPADAESLESSISATGAYVAFSSKATNLVASDLNGTTDIFAYAGGTVTKITQGVDGSDASGTSNFPQISSAGGYVVYSSNAQNLVADDTNRASDIFRTSRTLLSTIRVSVDDANQQADGRSTFASVSSDGNLIAFDSLATNLVAGDTNGARDVFVRDIGAGTTTRIANGAQPNSSSEGPWVTSDGSDIVFRSTASNLVGGDTNGVFDAFISPL